VQHPNDFVPLRKQLKEEAKKAKSHSRNGRGKKQVAANDEWELTVGIEIHAQLNSEAKLFSSSYMVRRCV
jgi:aspartyl-tRNA(Asn)/glutamyl-tRNA(Gln) amidotransferase subunit B